VTSCASAIHKPWSPRPPALRLPPALRFSFRNTPWIAFTAVPKLSKVSALQRSAMVSNFSQLLATQSAALLSCLILDQNTCDHWPTILLALRTRFNWPPPAVHDRISCATFCADLKGWKLAFLVRKGLPLNPGSRHGIRGPPRCSRVWPQAISSSALVLRSIAEVPQQRSLMVLWCLEAASSAQLLAWLPRAAAQNRASSALAAPASKCALGASGNSPASQAAMLQSLGRKLFLCLTEVGSELPYPDQELGPDVAPADGPAESATPDKQQGPGVRSYIGELKECQQRVNSMKLMLDINERAHTRSKGHPKDFRDPRRREEPPPAPVTRPARSLLWCGAPGESPVAGPAGSIRSHSGRVRVELRQRHGCQEVAVLLLRDCGLGPGCGGHIRRDDIDECEPTLMIVLPRLAVLHGLLVHPDGPLSTKDRPASKLCPLFPAFHSHLDRVRSFLGKLKQPDMDRLVRRLCLTESGDATDAEADVDADADRVGRTVQRCARDQIQSNYAWEPAPTCSAGVYNLHCSEAVDEAAASAAAATATLAVEEGLDAFDWQVTDSVQSASTLMATAAATGAEASAVEPPAWVPDSASDVCTNRRCGQAFTITRPAAPLPGLPVRLCDACCVSAAAVNENNGDRA
uniref:UBC core domain-containing protein n=1 Tax=Macrostomum lignano TaxID=282301 RepID=A0A1I8FR78_9PLAT